MSGKAGLIERIRSRPSYKRKCKEVGTAPTPLASKRFRLGNLEEVVTNDENADRDASLPNLPNEILLKIFDLLPFDDLFNLDCVNRRLREVIKKLIWSKMSTLDHVLLVKNAYYPRISLTDPRDKKWSMMYEDEKPGFESKKLFQITDKWVKLFLSRTNILHLDLSFYFPAISNKISSILYLVPQLLKLNLSSIGLKNRDLITIAIHCELLEEVSFDDSFGRRNTDKGLTAIFINNPKIRYLNLANNREIDGESFQYISTQLRYLKLSLSYNLKQNAMKYLVGRTKKLETLILKNYSPSGFNINDWLRNLKKLRYLEISDSVRYSFPHPINFIKMEELEIIQLKNNLFVTIETLESLQHSKKLKALDLSGARELNINNEKFDILKKFKSLKQCNFSGMTNLTGLVDFVKICKLEYLAINSSKGLTADILKELINKCDSLTHLEVMGDNDCDYDKILPLAFKNASFIERKNTLKLAVLEGIEETLPSFKWLEIISSDCCSKPPFPQFINVQNQYHKS